MVIVKIFQKNIATFVVTEYTVVEVTHVDIGSKIREIRKDKGLSQIEVAQAAHIAINTLRLYESNKRQPRLDLLGKIALALNTTVFELVGSDWRQIDMSGAFDFDDGHKSRDDGHKSRLNAAFNSLNNKGKAVAVERVEELTKIPDYKRAVTPAESTQEPPVDE